jgi:ATP phosphoribosyltransferase
MSRYVENGTLDAGLTGKDWIAENNSDVHVVADLVYSKVSSRPGPLGAGGSLRFDIRTLEDLQGKKIATELVSYTEKYFNDRKIDVQVEFSWGATEAKVVSGLADAIVEVTETESTIKAHGLRIIHELMQTNTQLITNHNSWREIQKKEHRADRHAVERAPCLEKSWWAENERAPKPAGGDRRPHCPA